MKIFISFLARQIYKTDYLFFKEKLLSLHKEAKNQILCNNPEVLTKLLISGEDHRFKYHLGFDIIAIIRACRNNIFYNKKEGASTIEQQLVRVLTNDFKLTFSRKVKEIFLSTTTSDLVPKNIIPLLYLHVAYYGDGLTGIKKVFENHSIASNSTISLEFAAEIVAQIKYPRAKCFTEKRNRQIETRKKHLLHLHKKNITSIF